MSPTLILKHTKTFKLLKRLTKVKEKISKQCPKQTNKEIKPKSNILKLWEKEIYPFYFIFGLGATVDVCGLLRAQCLGVILGGAWNL